SLEGAKERAAADDVHARAEAGQKSQEVQVAAALHEETHFRTERGEGRHQASVVVLEGLARVDVGRSADALGEAAQGDVFTPELAPAVAEMVHWFAPVSPAICLPGSVEEPLRGAQVLGGRRRAHSM